MNLLLYFVLLICLYIGGLLNSDQILFMRLPISFVLIIVFLILFLLRKKKKIEWSGMILGYKIILLLIVISIIKNIIEGIGLNQIASSIGVIKVLFLLIPIIYIHDNQQKLKNFIKVILIFGVVFSFITISQSFFALELDGSKITFEQFIFARVYSPGVALFSFCLILIFSLYIEFGLRGEFRNYILFAPIYILGILVTMHRNIIFMTIICFTIIFFINIFNKKATTIIRTLFIITILFIIIYYLLSSFDLVSGISERGELGIQDMQYNEGTYGYRFFLIETTLNTIIKKDYLFGFGFNVIGSHIDPTYYNVLSADSDVRNILLLFGMIGLFIFAFFYINSFLFSIKLYKQAETSFIRAISLAVLVMPIYFVGISFFSSVIYSTPFATVLISSIGIMSILKNINGK